MLQSYEYNNLKLKRKLNDFLLTLLIKENTIRQTL